MGAQRLFIAILCFFPSLVASVPHAGKAYAADANLAALDGDWITKDGSQRFTITKNGEVWFHGKFGSAHIRPGTGAADMVVAYDSYRPIECQYQFVLSGETLYLTLFNNTQDPQFCPVGGIDRIGGGNHDVLFWTSIQNSKDPELFREYIKRFPNGEFVLIAQSRVRALEAAAPQPVDHGGAAIKEELWTLNRSLMILRISGDHRDFYYRIPRDELRAYGISEGSINFGGAVSGDLLVGQSYVYSRKCGKRYFAATGKISDGKVVLIGKAPTMFDETCVPQSYRDDISIYERVGNP